MMSYAVAQTGIHLSHLSFEGLFETHSSILCQTVCSEFSFKVILASFFLIENMMKWPFIFVI